MDTQTHSISAVASERKTEPSFMEETTVEVCIKMVVSRKFIMRRTDLLTGKVVSTDIKTEEDQPTVHSIHTYTLPPVTIARGHLNMDIVPKSCPLPLPRLIAAPDKRRPGRPRKYPVPRSTLSVVSDLQTELTNDACSVKKGAVTSESSASPPESQVSGEGKGLDETVKPSAESALKSADPKNVASTPERKPVLSAKAGQLRKLHPGRPPRQIKKPRKYLDSMDTEELARILPEAAEETVQEAADEDDVADADWDSNKGPAGTEENEVKEEEEAGKTKGERIKLGEAAENMHAENGGEQLLKECPKCSKKFTYASNFQRHIAKNSCTDKHQCAFCDQTFSSQNIFEQHFEIHRDLANPNNFRCSDCNRLYATRNGFMKHKRQGTCYKRDIFNEDGTQGEFACNMCSTRFTSEKMLALHKDKVHVNPVSEHKCPDCSRIFYTKRGYIKHVAKKTCTLPYKCGVCGKQYSNKAKESYKAHIKFHLAEASGVQYQCEDCGRVYMTLIALKKHHKSHTGIRPYKCAICNKAFPMRYMVRDHERTHTGEKPYLCSLCGCPFANRGHLYRHLRSHQHGTLHKRGRPRKYPPGTHTLRLPRNTVTKTEQPEDGDDIVLLGDGTQMGWVKVEGRSLGEVEIKGDQDMQEEALDSAQVLSHGPTYITVTAVDPSMGDMALGEGHLQHVVMETSDGVAENVVLQVIRDLTGATTVYQTVTDMQGIMAASTAEDSILMTSEGQESQVVVTTMSQAGEPSESQVIVTSALPPNSTAVS